MKRSLFLIASAMVFTGFAAADEPPLLPDDYTIQCKTQQQVGFDWRDGRWVGAQFQGADLIVRRSVDNLCLGEPEGSLKEDTFQVRGVCLNIRNAGTQYYPLLSQHCTEAYNWRNGKWDTTIACKKPVIHLRLDGWFHYASIHGDLTNTPKDGYKESQYVAVGKCTRM